MRNLLQHPLTAAEVAGILASIAQETVIQEVRDGTVGDIRAYAVIVASAFIQAQSEFFDAACSNDPLGEMAAPLMARVYEEAKAKLDAGDVE